MGLQVTEEIKLRRTSPSILILTFKKWPLQKKQ